MKKLYYFLVGVCEVVLYPPRCAWCHGHILFWEMEVSRMFGGKAVGMHCDCAAYSIVKEIESINSEYVRRYNEAEWELQGQAETRLAPRIRPN